MVNNRTISNTFTVNTVLDGESAPLYTEELYAWSNTVSTPSPTTEPYVDSGWSRSIPNKGGYAYLWKMIVRHVWDENIRDYRAETPEYFRMSGTNGTSIHTRGEVANASSRGNGTATIITDNGTQTITLSDGDAVTQLDNGHLYQWVTEGGGKWLDLGQFQGQSGVTYYTHIVWATYVKVSALGLVQRIDGYLAEKDSNDTTHNWMGTYIDENSSDPVNGDDPLLLDYTWTEIRGDDATVYRIRATVESVKIPTDQTTTSKTISFYFTSQEGANAAQALDAYYSIYYRNSDNLHTLITPSYATKGESVSYNFANIPSSQVCIVIFLWGTTSASSYRGMFPEGQPYIIKKEIPILKDGDTGATGERGSLGRNYYYAGEFDDSDTQKLYVVNDAQVPFFMHLESGQKRYHVFNPETSPQSGSMTMAQMWSESGSSWSNLPWEVMSNDFKYLISEAVFADFARFASFVMMGHFMFSLQGRWINDRYKDGATLIEYNIFTQNGGSSTIQATAYSFINTEETGVDRVAEFENMSEAGTSVDYKYIVENSIHFVKGTMYSLTWESVSGCRIHLIDSQGNNYGLNSITKDQCFQVNTTGDYYVVADRTGSGGISYSKVSLYQRYFSPNVCINGNTGDASMNNFKGSANLTQLWVSKGEMGEGSGVANLGGITYIKQPIFYPDYDAGSHSQDVPNLDTLPQIPLCKYVEVVRKDSEGGIDIPDSAGKLIIESSTGYLKYIPILTNP